MTSPVLQRLAAAAPPLCVWHGGVGDIVECELPIEFLDGVWIHYALEIQAQGMRAVAKEVVPMHLPAFCPQRHINGDGTFCLFWEGSERLDIVDEEAADAWWRKLYRFFHYQRRAARQRRWPFKDWAHGGAAEHQALAEQAAAALGPSFSELLETGRLEVIRDTRRNDGRGPILRMHLNGVHLYSAWEQSGSVLNSKRRCFCGTSGAQRPKRLRRCGKHAKAAAQLAGELYRQAKAEESFWTGVMKMNRACCQTCDVCPLKDRSGGA